MIPYTEVLPPWWDDRPVLIVGTGLSLSGFDLSRLKGLGYILAVKNAIDDLPFADACVGLDQHWPNKRYDYLCDVARRMSLYLAIGDDDPNRPHLKHRIIPNAIYIRRARTDKLSTDPRIIEFGGTSGYGAFNLSVLKRAKHIVLFGYDYTPDHYCHDRYVGQSKNHNANHWPLWAKVYDHALPILKSVGCTVLNASPKSFVTAFERVSLEQAMDHLDRLRTIRNTGLRGSAAVDHAPLDGTDPDLRGASVEAPAHGRLHPAS